MGFATGRDPLDDPLVTGWDAVVRNAPAPADADPADTALLRRFHALETIPPPSSTFFDDLERHLASLSPSVAPTVAAGPVPAEGPPHPSVIPTVAAGPVPAEGPPRPSVIPSAAEGPPRRGGFSRVTLPRVRPSAHRTTQTRPGWLPQHGRWVPMRAALAVLSVILIAGLFVLYQAVPGPSEPPAIPAAVVPKPALETMIQLDVAAPFLGLPSATSWTHMEFGMFEVAPGTSFTTDLPFYTSVDGPLLLMALNGKLTVIPAGPALFYPGNQPGQPPVEISAATTVSLGPNDAIVYSSADTATGSNPGSEPTLALYGMVGTIDSSLPGSSLTPRDVSRHSFEYVDPMPAFATNDVSVSLQRLELAPFDTFVFEPDTNWTFLPAFDLEKRDGLRISEGAVEGVVPEPGAQGIYGAAQLRYLNPGGTSPGPHTIFNIGDETVDFYFLVLEVAPDAGTPAP